MSKETINKKLEKTCTNICERYSVNHGLAIKNANRKTKAKTAYKEK